MNGTRLAGHTLPNGHQCARQGVGIRQLNGHTEPGDPDVCGAWIFWDGASESWLHVVMSLDRQHKAEKATAGR